MCTGASRRRKGDDGQVVTALVVLVSGLILAVVALGLVPLGQATDESSQAANAADAAALAGATQIKNDLVVQVQALLLEGLDDFLGRSTGCSAAGRAAAEDYAARNGAVVTSYCYRPARDRIEVGVEMTATALGASGPAKGDAVASLGLNFTECTREDEPAPTTTSTMGVPLPDPVPTLPPLPELPLRTSLQCSGVLLRFNVVPGTGQLRLVPPGRLAQVLNPRLIG